LEQSSAESPDLQIEASAGDLPDTAMEKDKQFARH